MNQDQAIDQVLRRIDDAKGLVAVRKVVLALQDQKACDRSGGHPDAEHAQVHLQFVNTAVQGGV